jgi:hypothetical protein
VYKIEVTEVRGTLAGALVVAFNGGPPLVSTTSGSPRAADRPHIFRFRSCLW